MLAPRASLDKLKCSQCRKYLSFFPVYLLENNVKICGRCASSPPDNSIQDETYQQLAKFLRFPCIFNVDGCLSTLLPSEVSDHEKSCTFRMEHCPTKELSGCVWRGCLKDVYAHCEESHPIFITEDSELELDLVNTNHQENMTKFSDETFIFKRTFDSETNIFSCCVVRFGYNSPIKNFTFRIVLQNIAKSMSMYIPEKEKDVLDKDDYICTSLDLMNEKLDDPTIIICKVELFLKDDTARNKKNNSNPNFDLELISDLECPVCFDYMIENIFLCETGHSICPNCKTKIAECPTCKFAIKDSRNFILEKMASRNKFPCKYKEFGCNFVAKPEVMRGHQQFCNNSRQECPLKDYLDCEWTDSFMNMLEHVKNDHHENFLEIETIEMFIDDDYFKQEDGESHILSAYNSLFKLHYLYKDEVFYWSLQLIGPPEDCKQFMLELDIVDNSGSGLRTYFKTCVSPLTTKTEFNELNKNFICISLTNIKSYIHNGTFTYGMFVVPEETLNSLKCSSCENYLSFFPIQLTVDKSMICGRCSSDEEFPKRNEIYETLASVMHFPCRYRLSGCGEHLLPENIPSHEKCCLYKHSKCPTSFLTKCSWEGPHCQYIQHCDNSHYNLWAHESEFEIESLLDTKDIRLLRYQSELYIFEYEFNRCDDSLNISFITLQSELPKCVLLVNIKGDMGSFIIKCLPNLMNNSSRICSSKIFCKSLKSEESIKIRCKIEISMSMADINARINETPLQVVRSIDFETKSCFLCVRCHKFSQVMASYKKFKNIRKYCISCYVVLHYDYNSEITYTYKAGVDSGLQLIFSCKFANNGCTFAKDIPAVIEHSKHCQYEKMQCLVNPDCESFLPRDIDIHMASHSGLICGKEIYLNSDSSRVTSFGGQWFLLTWSKTPEVYVWMIKLLTLFPQPDVTFKFYIDVVDEEKNQNMILSGLLKNNLEDKSYIRIERNQSFFNEYQNYKFKYYILKSKP